MNERAKDLKMVKTRYANSHGLSNSSNRSTAYDIALLCNYAMQNPLFHEVVSCRYYETTIK
jgi:serine-type D-Ala-D-Ala carboxypeptidase (penicillin-binding protein 5/6)